MKPITREFSGKKFNGKRITANIGETRIIQDAFAIPAPKNQWRLLLLQDVAPELTPDLPETKLVLDLLTKSLTVAK